MAYTVKALAVEPGGLRLSLGSTQWKETVTSHGLSSDLHVYPHTFSKYKVNNFNLKCVNKK